MPIAFSVAMIAREDIMSDEPLPLTSPANPTTAAAGPLIVTYQGMCDASAAVGLAGDHFVVGEDEHDILHVYRRGLPGRVAAIDLTDFLGNRLPSGKVKEADIEGAARIGGRIYWIASHGRDKSGNIEETRHRFFATDIDESGSVPTVAPAGTPYKTLLADLLAEPGLESLGLAAAVQKAPEDPGGFNIESLAATANGQLLIGLRNPRPAGRALIVPLTNPAAMIETGATPIFGDAVLLDLGGRGIRSIDRVGERFIIIAGPFGPAESDPDAARFALYAWSGVAGEAATLLPVDLGPLRPESLFEVAGTGELHVLSDDGDDLVGTKKCKDVPAADKRFRAITIMPP